MLYSQWKMLTQYRITEMSWGANVANGRRSRQKSSEDMWAVNGFIYHFHLLTFTQRCPHQSSMADSEAILMIMITNYLVSLLIMQNPLFYNFSVHPSSFCLFLGKNCAWIGCLEWPIYDDTKRVIYLHASTKRCSKLSMQNQKTQSGGNGDPWECF